MSTPRYDIIFPGDESRGHFPLPRNSSRQCLFPVVVEGVVNLGNPIQQGHIYFFAEARTRTSVVPSPPHGSEISDVEISLARYVARTYLNSRVKFNKF